MLDIRSCQAFTSLSLYVYLICNLPHENANQTVSNKKVFFYKNSASKVFVIIDV